MSQIQVERIKLLNQEKESQGDYVVYWMQASCRTHYNHALEYAIEIANKQGKPLITYFGLTEKYPEANLRHYSFLLEGLQEVKNSLQEMNVQLVVDIYSPEEGIVEVGRNATAVVTDEGYLDFQRKWKQEAANRLNCPFIQVETDVIVPVETASDKEEYTASTIRRKINNNLDRFMIPIKSKKPDKSSLGLDFEKESLDNLLNKLKIDRTVSEVEFLYGGTLEAQKHLKHFIKFKLERFADLRNDPTKDYLSNMSPYLHFGQISPLYLALCISGADSPGADSYLEELIIRRELSMNFVYYNSHYETIDCLPEWALKTLKQHENDPRKYIYSLEELENGKTHDPYWNAAQKEMVYTGKMHGYMRMYWGKKILEWMENPREAYQIALYLNNKYELDGRDPNGYTGVAWCFGKHDRAWKEREIFGKVRYMNDKGLKRKFKIDQYLDRVDGIIELVENGFKL
ncbi:MAG TPA: deoxyribodipyrimidine photo-lyase [Methanobacterium sp.]|jgi:deoxyribodipyrimidine photo-lyase|nr:MAG: deoxyribodipyrimidine photo-lyase [Methanobacterium sp.]HOI71474.1 deoxyribodipyrimidine photo-lyase [Methanobacterium sp.]